MALTTAQIAALAAGQGQWLARYRGRRTAQIAIGTVRLDVAAVVEELADRLRCCLSDEQAPTPLPLPAKKPKKGHA